MTVAIELTTEAGDVFTTEAGASLVAERSLPQYQGYEVFDIGANWERQPVQGVARGMTVLDNITGLHRVRAHTAGPVQTLDVFFTLEGRDQIREFRSWLAVFSGRQVPVWVPTGVADLVPTQDLSGSSIQVESVGYAGSLFTEPARKHLAVIKYDRTLFLRGVTSASDNGLTETLGLDSSLGETLAQEHTTISFLTLMRLQDDTITFTWTAPDLMDAKLTFVEVPLEAPTP